jgi:hypothetical protein
MGIARTVAIWHVALKVSPFRYLFLGRGNVQGAHADQHSIPDRRHRNSVRGVGRLSCESPNLLTVANANMGQQQLHRHYVDHSLDDPGIVNRGRYGDATYYMIPTGILPLLTPLEQLPMIGHALADTLGAPLRVLVEAAESTTVRGRPRRAAPQCRTRAESRALLADTIVGDDPLDAVDAVGGEPDTLEAARGGHVKRRDLIAGYSGVDQCGTVDD